MGAWVGVLGTLCGVIVGGYVTNFVNKRKFEQERDERRRVAAMQIEDQPAGLKARQASSLSSLLKRCRYSRPLCVELLRTVPNGNFRPHPDVPSGAFRS